MIDQSEVLNIVDELGFEDSHASPGYKLIKFKLIQTLANRVLLAQNMDCRAIDNDTAISLARKARFEYSFLNYNHLLATLENITVFANLVIEYAESAKANMDAGTAEPETKESEILGASDKPFDLNEETLMGWTLSGSLPDPDFTDEHNAQTRIQLQRTAPPFQGKSGQRIWLGSTVKEVFEKAYADLNLR